MNDEIALNRAITINIDRSEPEAKLPTMKRRLSNGYWKTLDGKWCVGSESHCEISAMQQFRRDCDINAWTEMIDVTIGLGRSPKPEDFKARLDRLVAENVTMRAKRDCLRKARSESKPEDFEELVADDQVDALSQAFDFVRYHEPRDANPTPADRLSTIVTMWPTSAIGGMYTRGKLAGLGLELVSYTVDQTADHKFGHRLKHYLNAGTLPEGWQLGDLVAEFDR
jgi:hypothetical protein